jgi:transposase InsO family protein
MAKKKKSAPRGRELATAYKLLVVQERLKGTPEKDVAMAFGVSAAAVQKWTTAFRRNGPAALESNRGRRGKAGLRPLRSANAREQVVALKREHEDWGTRKIRDVLERFQALGLSEQTIRRVLHEEGMVKTPEPKPDREHPPRRFERATPNQLWQSDIFTFRLRRAERLYVCVFMDDHSRFIVGHALAHHQKSALVMEAFERGIAAYGQPTEVLTDNGRQYTVWRGKTEFEETLARMGIQHIRSRPHHPQTLGKVERFWKTLWDEFLGRTVFAHVFDAQIRLEHYLSHYNFQRPHQGLDGLVPADRFFKAAAHVRAEIERQVQANELRLALEQPPRKPFYVVGQLGDQRLSIAAGASGLEVHVGDKSETIPLKEENHGTSTARRFAEETQEPAHATLAREENGSGLGREEPRAAGPVGALRRETGDERDRGRGDLARLLLSARDQGAQRDAARAGAGLGWRREPGRDGIASPDQAARGQAGESGSLAASSGTPAVRAAQADELGAGEDPPRSPSEDDNLLDAGWAQKLALLDDDETDEAAINDVIDEAAGFVRFDPDAGWRERGPLRWERKLAGADAPSDNLNDAQGQTTELHAGARATERPDAASTLRGDRGGARGSNDRDGSSESAWPVTQSLPNDPASRDGGDHRGAHAAAGGSTGEASPRSGAGSGECATPSGRGSVDSASGDGRAHDERRRWDCFRQDAAAALAGQEDEAGGPRACESTAATGDDDA